MQDFLFYILSGAFVGLAIGLTGVGGGSLMTPILLALNIPPQIAVGTDLLYAAGTKAFGVRLHHKKGHVKWKITSLMLLGSLPASGITIFLLRNLFTDSEAYKSILTTTLGSMLLITSILIFRRKELKPIQELPQEQPVKRTILMGVLLGALVTLSSVGAGVCGTAILFSLYPRLKTIKVVGTDIAHAVPLTFIAGMGHLYLGNVDWNLLAGLMIGSIPTTIIGTRLGHKIPDTLLRKGLALILLCMGIKYSFF